MIRGICAIAVFLAVGSAAWAASDRPDGIQIQLTDMNGPVYADAQGHTLYTWAGDDKGASKCTDVKYGRALAAGTGIQFFFPDQDRRPSCVQFWPPLQPKDDAKPLGAWSIIARPDGIKQWAYKGKPVYRSFLDEQLGEVNGTLSGNGAARGDRYPIVADEGLPPGVTFTVTKWGRALATADGDLLYFQGAPSAQKISTCDVECRSLWRPFQASALQSPANADWSIVDVGRGARQWAYKGEPLFSFVRPVKDSRLPLEGPPPGWKLAVVQALPVPPKDFTVTMSSIGEVIANAEGKTLYYFDCTEETPDRQFCDVKGTNQAARLGICGGPEKCRQTFLPVFAKKNAKAPNHTWTIVKIDKETYGRLADETQDGLYAWAYRGRPVYTYVGDEGPGDIEGHGFNLFATATYTVIKLSGGEYN